MFEKPDASEPAKKRTKLSIESTPSNYTADMQDDLENSIVMAEDTESPLKEFKEPSQLTEFLEHPEQFFLSEQFANTCVIEVSYIFYVVFKILQILAIVLANCKIPISPLCRKKRYWLTA